MLTPGVPCFWEPGPGGEVVMRGTLTEGRRGPASLAAGGRGLLGGDEPKVTATSDSGDRELLMAERRSSLSSFITLALMVDAEGAIDPGGGTSPTVGHGISSCRGGRPGAHGEPG